ncbi:34071_t:CDS:2, partial [Racocetra persica]
YTSLTLVEEEYDEDNINLDQNNEGENVINNKKISTKAMHGELLEYTEGGKIEKKNIPKIHTIKNWLNSYAQAFKKR